MKNKITDEKRKTFMEAKEKRNKILAMQMFLRERARIAHGGLDMNENNCEMCLSRNICTPQIKKECQGHFILDKGLSAYYQKVVR